MTAQKTIAGDECYQRAKSRNQLTFTLIEQDRSSVQTIAFWILQNIQTAPEEKLYDALGIAIRMRDYSAVKDAD
jgi:hypothetical protein